jgi:hypothetical protein
MPPDLAMARSFFTASGPMARGTMGSDFLPHAEKRAMQTMLITTARKSLMQGIATRSDRNAKNLSVS